MSVVTTTPSSAQDKQTAQKCASCNKSVIKTNQQQQQDKQAAQKCATCNKPVIKTNQQQAVKNKNVPQKPPQPNNTNKQIAKVELVKGAVKTNMKKVTDDLVKIIKNLQTQLNRISKDRKPEEDNLIEPKQKEFFKRTPSTIKNGNNTSNKLQKSNTTVTKVASSNKKSNITVTSSNRRSNTTVMSSGKKSVMNVKQNSSRSNSSTRPIRSNSVVQNNSSLPSKVASVKSATQGSKQSSSNSLTPSNKLFLKHLHTPSVDPLKILKDEVLKAIRARKTFTVRGHFGAIRQALLQRGWVEKLHISYKDHLNSELRRFQSYSIPELINMARNQTVTTICKSMIKSKLMGTHQVDFYYGYNYDGFKENPDKVKFTMINKLKRDIASYTNKQGLCEASKVAHWYNIPGVAKLNHPRSYSLAKNGDTKGFTNDFYLTAALSLLKWVVMNSLSGECKIISSSGRIPLEVFEFAANECCKFIKKSKHDDIDKPIVEASEHEWTEFLDFYYKTIHFSNHFRKEHNETEDSLVKRANIILNNIRDYWPCLDMDGLMNIWILKPAGGCRGKGIHICRTLEYVLKTIKQKSNIRYIIQKYVERPLLIYKTKFDIRQWFLISSSSPLTIWIYKESYLRFSSQTYNLRKLHESIHLTNNAVQIRYKNTSLDSALPTHNMWDSNEFQTYLSNIGYPNVFKHVIYPGMRKNICAAILMHQHKMICRKNSFELYGADFILTEDFQPWLLEINSSPALHPSTPITARLCPRVLEDVIKVMIDHGSNPKASTGGFELAYKEKHTVVPVRNSLELFGHPLRKDYFYTPPEYKKSASAIKDNKNQKCSSQKGDCLQDFGVEIKNTLRNILNIIQDGKIHSDIKDMGCGSFAIS